MIRRSPQGRPVIVHAGQSEAGRALAAQTAEVVFTVEQDIEKAREFYADLKAARRAAAAPPESIKIMPGVHGGGRPQQGEAEDKYARCSR